jgi:hypothetical protein
MGIGGRMKIDQKAVDITRTLLEEQISKLVHEHKDLQYALASILEQADADCPSEYRTDWFRESMNNGYDLLKKVGFFRMINKKQKEVA